MRRALKLLSLLSLLLAAFTGCRHSTPFTEELYFRALGESDQMILTIDMRKSAHLLEGTGFSGGLGPVIDRSDRLSAAYSLNEEDSLLYGGLEGNYGRLLTNTALSFSDQFTRVDGELGYYQDSQSDLKVMVPKSGIVLFTTGQMVDVYTRSFKERKLFVPEVVAEKMADGLCAIYMEDPQDASLITDMIPKTMIQSIDTLWVVLQQDDRYYRVSGLIDTRSSSASRVLSTLLRMNYLVSIKELDEPLESWQDDIAQDGNTIMLDSMYIPEQTVRNLFKSIAEQALQQ